MLIGRKQIVINGLARVEAIQKMIIQLDDMCSFIGSHTRKTVDIGDIRSELVRIELDEWRTIAMWGLTLSDEDRDRVKAAMHEEFLGKDRVVSHYLNNGVSPGMWLSADDEEFREMARDAFRPDNKKADERGDREGR